MSWHSKFSRSDPDLIELVLGQDFRCCLTPLLSSVPAVSPPADSSNFSYTSILEPISIQVTHFLLQQRGLTHQRKTWEILEKNTEQSDQKSKRETRKLNVVNLKKKTTRGTVSQTV